MPSINVRLTEGQHEALRAEAFERRLSIQKLVVGRLFGNGLEADRPGVGDESMAQEGSVSPAALKPCSRRARHHINHGGNPCPECGWPAKVGE